ncbi:MAG: hypothetical protein GX091_10625 [Peptococcaceae bacterium]|nr:hypothetical protein [Peptococcaceae bacterium]
MSSENDIQLKQAQQSVARLHKIDAILQDLKVEQVELARRKYELEKILLKENDDVFKLERTGLASLFYIVLGRFEEKMDKERQEALAAKLKYDQAKRDLADVEARIAELTAERGQYLHYPQIFEELCAQKKAELMQENGETAEKIFELENAQNQAKINLQEIQEAIEAGEAVSECLQAAEQSLDKALGWGIFDLLGGGLISTFAKHSHIDDAESKIEEAQRLLRSFRTELADIQFHTDIWMETGGFAKFADFFFDGLIADWFMQSKIKHSHESVSKVKNKVSDILEQLQYLKNKENSRIEQLEEEIKTTIVNAK